MHPRVKSLYIQLTFTESIHSKSCFLTARPNISLCLVPRLEHPKLILEV